ncbi:hypothetical protein SVIOM342S_09716 [Streptomyces violaceorubidus]
MTTSRDAVRVLRAALEVDAAAQGRVGGDAVVALDAHPSLVVAQAAVRDLAEQAEGVGRSVPGGEDHDVRVQEALLAGDRAGRHGGAHPVRRLLDVGDPGHVEEAQPLGAQDLLPVRLPVQVVDQLDVHHGVVGVAVIVHQPSFDAAGRGEVVVDGRRVEDPVRERAVVGGAVAVAGEDRADLGRGEAAVQVGDVLGGTLPGADDDEPGGRRALQRIDPGQQFGVVPDAVAALHALRHEGAQSGADDEVARPVEFQPSPERTVTSRWSTTPFRTTGATSAGLVAVGDHVVDLGRGPLEVVVELRPAAGTGFCG